MGNWSEFVFHEPFEGEMIQKVNGVELPADYIDFIRKHNGGEGVVADAYIVLFRMEELFEVNEDYQVEEYLPNTCIIGTDGGGEIFGIDKEGNYFAVPAVSISEEDKIYLGTSINDFAAYFSKILSE